MKHLSRLFPLIGLGLFVWVVMHVGPSSIAATISTMDARAFLLCPLFVFITLVLKSYKWHLVLRATGITYPFWSCVKVWSIGFFGGLVIPAKLGDVARIYYLRRDTGTSATESLSTIFVDRLLDVAGLLVFVSISIAILALWLQVPLGMGIVIAAVIAVAGVAILSTNETLVRTVLRPPFRFFVPRKWHPGFRDVFNRFYKSIAMAKQRKHVLFAAFALNILTWLVLIGYAYVIMQSLHLPLTFMEVTAMLPLIALVELIPITVSGLGTRDAAVLSFFALVGASPAAAVSFSLAYVVLAAWAIGIPGLLWWIRDPIAFKKA